jgi:proton-dependent oligopeptide transporter, POT family
MTTSIGRDSVLTAASAREKHPSALSTLFFTEMWERYSYYTMRALLVLYLVNAVGLQRADALEIYGTYTGLVYLTPILGGYLADRYFGRRKAILIGGITMALGHFAMAFESLLYPALGLLIIGNGFFKPNISSLLGTLYRENDPRRDRGFTIFYMGVNLGAFLSGVIGGTLGEKMGWHWGFASAGVGMCIGVAQFLSSQHKLGSAGLPAGSDRLIARDLIEVLTVSFAAIPLVYLVMSAWRGVGPWWTALPGMGKLGVVALVIAALWAMSRTRAGALDERLSGEEWQRILAILIMGFFVVFFWAGFEQAGGTMNLFADKQTDRMIFGWDMPATWFQSVNPLFVVLLGPLVSGLWALLYRRRIEPSAPAKMGLGMIILGLGFIILAIAQARAETLGKVGIQWLFIVYIMHTTGELFLSPVGLSMVTKLAPVRLGSMLMGVWYLANAVANYLAGTLEKMLSGFNIPLYWFLVGSSIGAGALLLLLTPVIKYLMRGKG